MSHRTFRCRHCGRTDDLIPEDDGWPSDICNGCAEIGAERYRQRREWNDYHDEPCPEIELTPFPTRTDT